MHGKVAEPDLARDRRGCGQKSHHSLCHARLAGPQLADDGEDLPAPDFEAEVAHCPNHAGPGTERDVQTADRQRRLRFLDNCRVRAHTPVQLRPTCRLA